MTVVLRPEEAKAFIEKPFAFVERIGLRALIMAPRHVKLGLPLEGNANHLGSIYAGALFTVAELPGGALFLTTFDVERFYPLLKAMQIRFRRPALTDVTVEVAMTREEAGRIAAEAETEGKAEFILQTAIRDADHRVVAETEGIYQLRKTGPAP
ncbi:MAG: YiiD C-terminal domain-containing protein [Desulfobacterales bacterium]|jgi:acyl-coenzyme A thioesterase PaaI-like protein